MGPKRNPSPYWRYLASLSPDGVNCELRTADKKQRSWAAAGLAISLARLGSAWAPGEYLTQGKADDTANSEMGMARCGW
ncbi:hypothetical protein LA080_001012 [Diaporthe eres]|nr:hypothetical protein LA080_001012 [Diaporthe eres]